MNPAAGGLEHGSATCDGDRIHYVVRGEGPPLLLLHGAYGSGEGLLQTPLGQGLTDNFQVLAPDSLGHGQSDAPADPARYSPERRAAQLAAVLDAAGLGRVHVCGYSMGGWMASALAAFHSERILTLAIGGWDVLDGMYTPARLWGFERIDYEILTKLVSQSRPDLLDGVAPEREGGLKASIDAMNLLSGLAEGVLDCGAPTAIWMGRDDAYDAAARAFARRHGLAYLSLPGDHASAIQAHGQTAAEALTKFMNSGGRLATADERLAQ